MWEEFLSIDLNCMYLFYSWPPQGVWFVICGPLCRPIKSNKINHCCCRGHVTNVNQDSNRTLNKCLRLMNVTTPLNKVAMVIFKYLGGHLVPINTPNILTSISANPSLISWHANSLKLGFNCVIVDSYTGIPMDGNEAHRYCLVADATKSGGFSLSTTTKSALVEAIRSLTLDLTIGYHAKWRRPLETKLYGYRDWWW